jgi:CDP-diglyceride synthetase
MIEDELVKIWHSSPNQERIKFEKSRLMIEVQSTVDHFHKKIRYRDLMEQIAAVVVIPVFAYYAYSIPFTLTKIASVLIIFWAVYVIIRLRNAKKHQPGAFTETYLEYLYKTREYLHIQKKLLDNVIYWYILPGMTLVLLFVMGFMGVAGKSSYIIRMSVANVVLAVAAYFLNKMAVKKQIMPRLEKIDELIKVMEAS